MALPKKEKQPSEVLDYDIEHPSPDLPRDDSIASATASVVCITDPLDTALTLGELTWSGRRVKVWTEGGTDGHDYKVTVLAVSAGGRTFETEFTMKIREQ